jgi:WD40 repeat protein
MGFFQVRPVLAQKAETRLEHEGPVNGVAFSPGGKILAAVGERADKSGDVILWDLTTGKHLARLEGHPAGVQHVVFAPDGKTLGTRSDHQLYLWDVGSGKLLSKMSDVDFLGKHGVGRAADGCFECWDVAKKQLPRTWRCRDPIVHDQGCIYRPALSADGEQLALVVAGEDMLKVAVLDLGTLVPRNLFSIDSIKGAWVESLALSPDGQVLAVGSPHDLTLWDVPAGKLRGVLAHGPADAEV